MKKAIWSLAASISVASSVVALPTVSFASADACAVAFGKAPSSLSFLSLRQNVEIHTKASVALRDPLIDEGRKLAVVDDFKYLADLSPRKMSAADRAAIDAHAHGVENADGRKAAVTYLIEALYEHKNELIEVADPTLTKKWTLDAGPHKATFDHVEHMVSVLVRRTPKATDSSLIPLPYPIFIPGARFQEGYYWDTFFIFNHMLRTGRQDLVRGQIENFLFMLKNYKMIPNGTRDYYLTRSQPPMISQMVRVYVENEIKTTGSVSVETRTWLANDVFPLIKADYQSFWMNKDTRLDQASGLNHHWDALNEPRPERHSTDKEESLGLTYRDPRAEAESGKDFTAAFEGDASHSAPVMLNSLLFQVEKDLSWMASLTGKTAEVPALEAAAEKRKIAMNKLMWDKQTGVFRDYNFATMKQSPVVTADIFLPLYTKLATDEQAASTVQQLNRLERKGGLMSSEIDSGKQWDAPFGWAPHHYFAIKGLQNYSFDQAAKRLGNKWVRSIDSIYAKTGKIIEKIDAVAGGIPVEAGDKYPTQDGFLWSNGVYAWVITDVLGMQIKPNDKSAEVVTYKQAN